MRRKEREEEDREAKRLAEKAEQKRDEELKRDRERVEKAYTLIWSVGWRNKRKEDLKDLCYALGLSREGTREGMIKRVEAHLADRPTLANDDRFRALFVSKVTEM
ncbi:hypothetical protein OPQ81_005002 [Rhizoctonia solani]|nr:hypothetical protein OPQ81_005002 [Rhizoctonia solani]